MKIFECWGPESNSSTDNSFRLLDVGRNSLFKHDTYNDSVALFTITHSFCETEINSIVNSISKLPIEKYKLSILDFSHFDFPIELETFKKLNELYSNIYFLTNNWRLVEFENHSLFDPKLYKFEILDSIDYTKRLFKNNLDYIRPKKFINLTNHVRRERVFLLDSLYKFKDFGYISFPNVDKFDDDIKNIDESHGGWERTYEFIKNSSFYNHLPINFDFIEKEKYSSSSNYEILDTNLKKKALENVGLKFNYGMYLTSYLEIFSETYYSKSFDRPDFPIHSSEKTLNPIWAHLPLTILDVKDKLKYMKMLGFSFECPFHTPIEIDSMIASDDKTNKFVNFCDNLVQMDTYDMHTIYLKYFDEFQHNFDIMTSKLSKKYIIDKILKNFI